MWNLARVMLIAALAAVAWRADAAETDQFLTWNLELSDAAPAFNEFLNREIEAFLERQNTWVPRADSVETLVADLYTYLFKGLYSSRVRNFLNTAEEVERFPDRSVSFFDYQRMSVFRDLTYFPFVLPMARTVRIGEVYFGTDKIGHFFGFGRRYYQRYLRFRAEGIPSEEAMEKVVRIGITNEANFVGGLVDGIFSHADMEANFQGMLFAIALGEGPDPHIAEVDGRWTLVRPIDIRPFVTPDFDESFNYSHYSRGRWKRVKPILEAEYTPLLAEASPVRKRFLQYTAGYTPSLSKRVIDAHFEDKSSNPQLARSMHALNPAAGGD